MDRVHNAVLAHLVWGYEPTVVLLPASMDDDPGFKPLPELFAGLKDYGVDLSSGTVPGVVSAFPTMGMVASM
jgi:hypothetical protein